MTEEQVDRLIQVLKRIADALDILSAKDMIITLKGEK